VQIVLSGLGSHFPLPILLVQHIARGFVEALVDWLNTTIPLKVVIAQPNQRMEPGVVYLAPDERHIFAFSKGYIGLRDNVATDRFCPSADVLFESMAQVYGSEAIGVILTGMGDDGARGMRSMRVRGGQTYAQDEASCVVYGMPHAAVSAGAVVRVAPLDQIAPAVLQYIGTDVLSATGR
jgi:two-component system chemotaxis response regulator CheB